MLKRKSKSIMGLILVIALVFSMFPTLPSSVAYAAVTNLLPSTLTSNGNIKASSQNGTTRAAPFIGSTGGWTLGSNTIFSVTDSSNLWVAIDLGSSSKIEGFNFHTNADDVNTKKRSPQYEVSYSNDDTPLTSPWNKLSTKPVNTTTYFSPTANGWTSAAIVPTATTTGTIPNGTYDWSLVGGFYTSNLTFTAPITARYILINYTLNPNPTSAPIAGTLGIASLKIIPPVTLSSSSGSFYKTLQNTVTTAVYLDSVSSFTSITNGSNTLVKGTDYTVDVDNVVAFSQTYLNSLNGSYNLSFNFSSSQGASSLPYVLTVAAAADSSLSPQGAAYIPTSPSTISTTMNLNSNNFTNISEGTTILPSGAYVVTGNTVTFNQSYINTLSMGAHSFIFNFNQGNPQTYMLTISGKPPVANIDYRYWTLQEPLPGGAGQTSQALQAGYVDPYFYVGADGSQVFMDTAVGGTTSGSAHPRSELREYDPIAGTDAGWLPAGANAMTNTVAVTTLGIASDGVGWTTIGQVFDTETTTLCELEYGYDPTRPNSNIRILYEPSGINSLGYQYLPIKIPLNQYFTYRMTLNDQVLSIYLNGALIFNGKTSSPSQVIPPNHHYYFKAGNYDQTAAKGNVNYVPYTVVQFKSINVYHASTVSSNADLSSLTLSSGTLSPAFASGTLAYTSNVANGVSNVTVTANVYDSSAMMTVNGTPVISGQASSAINLNVGSNVIPIVVTALNGTTKNYSITVNRAAASSNADLSSLTLSSGTLSPAFASGTTDYASTVASGVSNATVTASVYDSNAKMTVNGTPVVSGQASGVISLNTGSNTITIVVTAQNGTTKTYSITVNRAAASSNADLNSLTLSSGALSPAFASETTAYASNVASGVSSVTVTASVYDSNAMMTVNGTPVISGQASSAINLNVGSNVIPIVVTALNGTTKTYSITVNRALAPSSNADLSSLTLSSGTLSPAFVSGTTDYALTVASGVSNVTVTSSVYSTNATMAVNGIPVISGQASGEISLNLGSNTITIVVTAQNGTTKTYTINILRLHSNSSSNSSSTGSSSGGGAGTSPTQVGQATSINTEIKTVGGKSVAQAKVDDIIIDTALKASVNGNIKLAADSNVKADQINVSFNSGALQKITKDDKSKLLTIETKLGNYELPIKQIDLQDLAAKLGVSIENVNLEITVSLNDSAADKATASGQKVLAVADFTVKATSSDGKSIEVSIFSQYVRRTLKTEESLNTRNLAAVRVQTDNQGTTTYQPVPFTVNGKEISLYSRTNSTYMLFENNTTFADIKNHWAKDEIESMTNKFIVQGVSKDEFQPDQAVTRAEFAALIARTIGLKSETSSKIKFTDVRSNDWFEGQAYAAVEAGIVTGYDDQTFRPNQPISREEMAVMIYRAMKFTGFDDGGAVQKVTFTDENLFENWAKEAISVMADKKIVEGVASNKYDPKATATRAQSAVILKRMLAKLSFTN